MSHSAFASFSSEKKKILQLLTSTSPDPDLYDTLIRRFQSPAEREAERRARGWGKTLESSLMRGEARLEKVASSPAGGDAAPRPPSPPDSAISPAAANFVMDVDLAEGKPATREEGRAAWDEFVRERFVRGGDEDFDYGGVDGDEALDSMEARDREEAYFDEVEPEWADDDDDSDMEDGGGDGDDAMSGWNGRAGGERRPKRERILLGQTGIQDY